MEYENSKSYFKSSVWTKDGGISSTCPAVVCWCVYFLLHYRGWMPPGMIICFVCNVGSFVK